MEPQEPTLTWVTIDGSDQPAHILSVDEATSWYSDIALLERAASHRLPNRAYLIGTHADNWYVAIALEGNVSKGPIHVPSRDAGKHQAEEWERALKSTTI